MKRYLLAVLPAALLLGLGFAFRSGETNFLLREIGKAGFLCFALALMVTPAAKLFGLRDASGWRRAFGVWAAAFGAAHAAVFFAAEWKYSKALFVAAHWREWDVVTGGVLLAGMLILWATSNDASIRFLKSAWKGIQSAAYPLFALLAVHVAAASRWDGLYVALTAALVALRTAAWMKASPSPAESMGSLEVKWLCVPCGYVYDAAIGDPDSGIMPGTRFEDIPENWKCPVCGVGKADFVPLPAGDVSGKAAKVFSAAWLNPTVLELAIKPETPEKWLPGQYARVVLSDRDGSFARSYSVAGERDGALAFLVKIGDGRGGRALRRLKPGDAVGLDGVRGSFLLKPGSAPKVFVATGTGLAPILPMLRAAPAAARKTVLFGVANAADLFRVDELRSIPGTDVRVFISQEDVPGCERGRVDAAALDAPKETEFYLCGNPAMVDEQKAKLAAAGYANVYSESF